MNPINVTELKVRKTKISTIVTAVTAGLDKSPVEQNQVINSWGGAASRIFVYTAFDTKPGQGVRLIKSTMQQPNLHKLLGSYMMQIPGDEVFLILPPSYSVSADQQALFDHVERQKMGRAWAAKCLVGDKPVAFFLSSPVLPYILNDVPQGINLVGDAWADYMDKWLGRFVLKHRYFDATPFAVVGEYSAPVVEEAPVVQSAAPQPEPTPEPAAAPAVAQIQEAKPAAKGQVVGGIASSVPVPPPKIPTPSLINPSGGAKKPRLVKTRVNP